MSDYISRNAAIAYIREQSEEMGKAFEELGGESGIYADAYNDLAEDFHRIPAADVEPVRHGRWEGYSHSRYCGIDADGEPVTGTFQKAGGSTGSLTATMCTTTLSIAPSPTGCRCPNRRRKEGMEMQIEQSKARILADCIEGMAADAEDNGFRDGNPSFDCTRLWRREDDYCSRGQRRDQSADVRNMGQFAGDGKTGGPNDADQH